MELDVPNRNDMLFVVSPRSLCFIHFTPICKDFRTKASTLTYDILEERARLEVLVYGGRSWQTEQRLGRYHHQRLTEISRQLATQNVVVLSRCRGIDYMNVDAVAIWSCFLGVAELQKTFNAAGAVLGGRAIVAVGQQHDQGIRFHPFACL